MIPWRRLAGAAGRDHCLSPPPGPGFSPPPHYIVPDAKGWIPVDPNALDKLFISERDGQPFKIRYGVLGSAMGSSAPVIFESAGDSKGRLVGFLDMQQREVDESEYKSLWSATASQAPRRENR